MTTPFHELDTEFYLHNLSKIKVENVSEFLPDNFYLILIASFS